MRLGQSSEATLFSYARIASSRRSCLHLKKRARVRLEKEIDEPSSRQVQVQVQVWVREYPAHSPRWYRDCFTSDHDLLNDLPHATGHSDQAQHRNRYISAGHPNPRAAIQSPEALEEYRNSKQMKLDAKKPVQLRMTRVPNGT